MARTDREIVEQTNELALIALRYIGTGYVPQDEFFKVYEHLDEPTYALPGKGKRVRSGTALVITEGSQEGRLHARCSKAWDFACEVQELMTATDPNEALYAVSEDA